MQIIENLKIKEKIYKEKLENGLNVIIIPKPGIQKKYVIWGTNYGSNDSEFIVPGENQVTKVPNGVAHFLEHKLFEQENGTNSLDVLTALGVSANAYTTNDHTAFLFECTDNFYPALDEFMDYVQHPYFTDENVEKEKGIIGQEIMMYNDSPDWKVYLNALQAMYKENPVNIDITGTIESISEIDKDILYKCYNTFYNPSNMILVIAGDFKPEELIEEVKKRIVNKNGTSEIKRINPEEPDEVAKEIIEEKMQVSQPVYAIGIKDTLKTEDRSEQIRKTIAIEVLLGLMFGKSSKLYQELYKEGLIFGTPGLDYEFGRKYSHILITGQSKDPKKVYEKFKEEIKNLKENGVNEQDFNRIKKAIYGRYVLQFNDIHDMARMFMVDYLKNLDSFEFLEEMETLNLEYVNLILKSVFREDRMVLSIVQND